MAKIKHAWFRQGLLRINGLKSQTDRKIDGRTDVHTDHCMIPALRNHYNTFDINSSIFLSKTNCSLKYIRAIRFYEILLTHLQSEYTENMKGSITTSLFLIVIRIISFFLNLNRI